MFNTVVPTSFTGATGVTVFGKFVSGLNFVATTTGITLDLLANYVPQPGTGSAALVATGTGNVDAATHKYWMRALDYRLSGTLFVDTALSAAVVNDPTHKQNTLAIPAQVASVRALQIFRIEGAGSVTGQLLTTIKPDSDNQSVGSPGGTGGNIPVPYKTTITGFTLTDNTATANLGATGSNTTGTTNTTGVEAARYTANAFQAVDQNFVPPLTCPGAGSVWGIVLTGTGTISGTLRGR